MVTQAEQGQVMAKKKLPRGTATKFVVRCTCAYPGCGKDFGDPEGQREHGKGNFISWALWVIGHQEVSHARHACLQPSEVGRLLSVSYYEVPA